ncbi:MAG: ATP-binding cassette domain-containing protein, partial [Verrucomicrobiota bacterium]
MGVRARGHQPPERDREGCGESGPLAFSGVNFRLRKGGSAALTGPNGSGKSTLLRVLAGLLPPA